MSETFAAALRAEIDAVVGRYEALVKALAEMSRRDTDALRADAARLVGENERLRAEAGERGAEVTLLSARVAELERALADATTRGEKLERDAQAAIEATLAYEEQFAAEKKFVEACRELGGSLLGEALAGAVGRPIEATSAAYAALKAKGVEAALVTAVKDRGRSASQAPLLERERAALAGIAAAAGCELIVPPAGTRFSAASMEKAASLSDPAEEGNVVGCAMPGLRRAGTDGALVFPRVVVATG
jgi:ethanolamine utilization microcompartment shell protein EutL